MKSIGIAQIQLSNPMLASYVKTIHTWDEEGKFQIAKDAQTSSFYAIYLEDKFLGASTMQFNSVTSDVDISMINGSIQNYDRIQEESTKRLTDIALSQYGVKTVKIKQIGKAQ